MHPQRTPSVEDYPQIRRLCREVGSVSYLASYFGLTEEKILEVCVGEGLPYDSSRYLTLADMGALARKACA